MLWIVSARSATEPDTDHRRLRQGGDAEPTQADPQRPQPFRLDSMSSVVVSPWSWLCLPSRHEPPQPGAGGGWASMSV